MTWLLVALIAYFLFALVNVADKFIIERVITGAKAYTLLLGLAGLIIFILAPWFLQWPGGQLSFVDLLVGAYFALGLLFMYTALDDSEASKIFTLVGGISPILIVIFSVFLFQEDFTKDQLLAIGLLALGTFIISRTSNKRHIWSGVREWFNPSSRRQGRCFILGLVAALFFALFWVGTKYAYNTQPFFSALSWIRLGTFLAAALLLLRKKYRQEIKEDLLHVNKQRGDKFIVLGSQVFSGLAGILQNYAVALGSVALVMSLQGVQYALLLIFTSLLTIFKPKIIKEASNRRIMLQKFLAIILIGLGLYFLVL